MKLSLEIGGGGEAAGDDDGQSAPEDGVLVENNPMEGEDEGELQSGMATEQEAEVASEGVLQVEASSEDSAAKGEGDDEAEEEIAAGVVEGHDDEVDRQGEGQTGGGLLIHQASESDTEAEGEAEIQSEVEVGIDTVTGEKEVPEQGSATEGKSDGAL